jgi:hypothetical protein
MAWPKHIRLNVLLPFGETATRAIRAHREVRENLLPGETCRSRVAEKQKAQNRQAVAKRVFIAVTLPKPTGSQGSQEPTSSDLRASRESKRSRAWAEETI